MNKKQLHAAVAPIVKEVHRWANAYCVMGMHSSDPAPAGLVRSHHRSSASDGTAVVVGAYTFEATMIRRPRVVCNVPTPFSLFSFNYCLKLNGRPVAYGSTLDAFLTAAMRSIKKEEQYGTAA